MKNFRLYSDILTKYAMEKSDHRALQCGLDHYTYAQLKQAVDLCASDLIKLGVQPGDHVAIWSYNSIYWPIAYLGIIRAGGVAVLANYGMPSNIQEKLLSFTDVRFFAYGLNREILIDPTSVQRLAQKMGVKGIYDIRQDYIARIHAGETPDALIAESPDSRRTATLIFTSGTTDIPKAVQQSQYAMLQNSISCSRRLGDIPGERAIVALPLFHSYGLQIMLFYLMLGKTVCLTESLDPNVLVDALLTQKITDIFSVGILYISLIEHARFKHEIAPNIRFCGVGGSFTTPVQMMRFCLAFPNARFLCGYGQTEACTLISFHMPDDDLGKCSTTVGLPIDGLSMNISDASGNSMPVGKIGEVLVKCDFHMNGYYKLPPEAQPFDEDGWMHTGDLGYLDQEGYLHLTGRVKDIIIKNGENIVPSLIEEKIADLDGIQQVKVLGSPHPLFGETIVACIVPQPGAVIDSEEITRQLQKLLNSFLIPSHYLIYERFPINSQGKIDVRTLQYDMLSRLQRISITEQLASGVCIATVVIKNTAFNIVPVSAMMRNLAEALHFERRQTLRIRLAVEEMLLERIQNAFSDVGEITVKAVLYRDWFGIHFSDAGEPYAIEKNSNRSYSAMIILNQVDNFKILQGEDGHPIYCLEFKYSDNINISEFLKDFSRPDVCMLNNSVSPPTPNQQ